MTARADEKTQDVEPEKTCWMGDASIASALGPAEPEPEPEVTPEPTKAELQAAAEEKARQWERVREQRKRELLGAEHGVLEAEQILFAAQLRHLEEDLERKTESLKPLLDKLRREHREPDAGIWRLRQFPHFPGGLASVMYDLGPMQGKLARTKHRLAGVRKKLGLSAEVENVETSDNDT